MSMNKKKPTERNWKGSTCPDRICSGQGYIEIYEKEHGANRFENELYKFGIWCSCKTSKSEHAQLMRTHHYTPQQRATIEINRGNANLVTNPVTDGKLKAGGNA